LEGSALSECRSTQQTLQRTLQLQRQLEQQLQQQQERQNQLDQQQREVQQQLENMRLQNESLRKQLEIEAANQRARPVATVAAGNQDLPDAARSQDLKAWRAANPWYGTDYSRTQFAARYIKQLQKEHPDLSRRELLDAVSLKVDETFGAQH
jgi:chromosome segregation ATPase